MKTVVVDPPSPPPTVLVTVAGPPLAETVTVDAGRVLVTTVVSPIPLLAVTKTVVVAATPEPEPMVVVTTEVGGEGAEIVTVDGVADKVTVETPPLPPTVLVTTD